MSSEVTLERAAEIAQRLAEFQSWAGWRKAIYDQIERRRVCEADLEKFIQTTLGIVNTLSQAAIALEVELGALDQVLFYAERSGLVYVEPEPGVGPVATEEPAPEVES